MIPSTASLLQRLREAKEPSRELDRDIALAVNFPVPPSAGDYGEIEQRMKDVPRFTGSIDAAMQLFKCDGLDALAKTLALLLHRITHDNWKSGPEVTTADIALTACLASLQANGMEG